MLISLSGGTLLQSPGTNIPAVAFTALSIAIIPGVSIIATFTPSPIGGNMKIFFYGSGPLSPGISAIKKGYHFLTVSIGNASSPLNITSAYLAIFGILPAAGQKVFFSCFGTQLP